MIVSSKNGKKSWLTTQRQKRRKIFLSTKNTTVGWLVKQILGLGAREDKC
jgi:hypothetical protein